jgi:hypothetical protein
VPDSGRCGLADLCIVFGMLICGSPGAGSTVPHPFPVHPKRSGRCQAGHGTGRGTGFGLFSLPLAI